MGLINLNSRLAKPLSIRIAANNSVHIKLNNKGSTMGDDRGYNKKSLAQWQIVERHGTEG